MHKKPSHSTTSWGIHGSPCSQEKVHKKPSHSSGSSGISCHPRTDEKMDQKPSYSTSACIATISALTPPEVTAMRSGAIGPCRALM